MFAEVSTALHITRGAAARALGTGWSLRDRFPATLAALADGEIPARHAAVIVAAAGPIDLADGEAHRRYEEQVLPYAAAETAARTEAYAKSVVAAVAPETVVERHERAREDRRLVLTDYDDGNSLFGVITSTPLAHAAFDRATRIAREIRTIAAASACGGFTGPNAPRPGEEPTDAQFERLTEFESIVADLGEPLADERTLDQIRADVVTDVLLTGSGDVLAENGLDGVRGTVQVTVAATTLAGLDDRPAEFDGHGPIHPDIARELATTAGQWERLFQDPRGMLSHTDTYAPTGRMRRHLRARDRHCRFPGCRMPAKLCEIDHTFDHAKGGPTEIGNLSCLCAGHHALKHPDLDDRWRWTARQKPGGVIVWTSPTGRIYCDAPPPRVQFA
ncbi:HNH endonuclease signature motif containing protein [Microbacterium sp. ASV81]|uniref:DUF222 domain-containing protein n=1 Tax=Microbacterium capsulatum TaxID=3041921 RepID=A0ABU0XJQ3_9MICO|nr:DUF222 domain-containing protein [Microbacterium sp. ASV81]MDQ4214365.1 DUF222 domain-containing protein [Microbacterium sp. ASV81]